MPRSSAPSWCSSHSSCECTHRCRFTARRCCPAASQGSSIGTARSAQRRRRGKQLKHPQLLGKDGEAAEQLEPFALPKHGSPHPSAAPVLRLEDAQRLPRIQRRVQQHDRCGPQRDGRGSWVVGKQLLLWPPAADQLLCVYPLKSSVFSGLDRTGRLWFADEGRVRARQRLRRRERRVRRRVRRRPAVPGSATWRSTRTSTPSDPGAPASELARAVADLDCLQLEGTSHRLPADH